MLNDSDDGNLTNESSINIVSPTEMLNIMQGNALTPSIEPDAANKISQQNGNNSNSCKRYLLLKRHKQSKVLKLIEAVREVNYKYNDEDIRALFLDAAEYLNPIKMRKRDDDADNIQQQVAALNLPISKKRPILYMCNVLILLKKY